VNYTSVLGRYVGCRRFVRNNYDGPEIDPAQYALKVDGLVDNPLTLRLDDLKRMFPDRYRSTPVLVAAANRAGPVIR
jgi:DMSO/TMAO reductase YedYZ molybdopterin-dependent catalytic subunit